MNDFSVERARMLESHLKGRGLTDARMLAAFAAVPREAFVPAQLQRHAYDDAPLPIEAQQTISQPFIVALTVDALGLRGNERVLEIGTGSGYAAAILSVLAHDVTTIERIASLADSARQRLGRLGFRNVRVVHGDGTLGLPEHAPFDAIAVAAGGPAPPRSLLEQLAIGGRLVIPVGASGLQKLKRITRTTRDEYREETLLDVKFVPLIGREGWPEPAKSVLLSAPAAQPHGMTSLIRECAEPIDEIDGKGLEPLIERLASARVVLLGEATHGTSEFYRARARISRELIAHHGFQFVAVEADWPDAARIDEYVLGDERRSKLEFSPFERFPAWMWRNSEVYDFAEWLRAHNASRPGARIGFHGLDLYSLFTSIAVVLSYLDRTDPPAGQLARLRYGSLSSFQRDPTSYGRAVLTGRSKSAEQAVVATLEEMLKRRVDYTLSDGEKFFDAAQNARLVADAERYYRAMVQGSVASWNLRDSHMFDTLRSLFAFYGSGAKGIVWEHNSHVGDARATEMSRNGEHNVGQLCRTFYGDDAAIVGFGTHHGTVAAAADWGEPMEVMRVRPSRDDSYEGLFHLTNIGAFALSLRMRRSLREELSASRLERAIGVVYRPHTELQSHYFEAQLPSQFDEYVWFDETRAIEPLSAAQGSSSGRPPSYPFGG